MIFFVALRKELTEQWRTYRLLIVAAVLIIFGLTSPLLAKLTPELLRLIPGSEELVTLMPQPTAVDAVAQYVKNLGQFGVLLALLMAMGAVAQEKDKGTASIMLVKPLPRWAFLAAKFAALALTFAVSIALAAAAGYFYTLLLFEAMDTIRWLALNGLLLVFMLVYVALTLFCSTLTKSQVTAAALAFSLVIVLLGLGAIPPVARVLPNQLVTWGAALMVGSAGTDWSALWVSLGMILAALVGAWVVFERQEL